MKNRWLTPTIVLLNVLHLVMIAIKLYLSWRAEQGHYAWKLSDLLFAGIFLCVCVEGYLMKKFHYEIPLPLRIFTIAAAMLVLVVFCVAMWRMR